jgi:spermidine synthase
MVPGEGSELRLLRRRDEYSLRTALHGELMNSRSHGSEDALGTLTCERLAGRRSARVLIGGLGMGFTLATALATLAPDATVVVAELLPEVVRWNQDILGACAGHPLRDPRVRVEQVDVHSLIRNARGAYDAIALDVDNGPEGLTRLANDRLYSLQGLSNTYRALRADGTLAVWSAGPDEAFTDRIRKTGFLVDVRRVRAHGKKGARHVIWLARRP